MISNHERSASRVDSQFLTARKFGATLPIDAIREKDCSAFSSEAASTQKTPQNLVSHVSGTFNTLIIVKIPVLVFKREFAAELGLA